MFACKSKAIFYVPIKSPSEVEKYEKTEKSEKLIGQRSRTGL
jgi:hypothetical protein